ncbi:MAG: hypothetical protein ACOX87_02695, partial [Chloroflexota bacterium]
GAPAPTMLLYDYLVNSHYGQAPKPAFYRKLGAHPRFGSILGVQSVLMWYSFILPVLRRQFGGIW